MSDAAARLDAVELDDGVGPRWSERGPIVVYDGFEEPEALRGRVITPACVACRAPVVVAVDVVLGRGHELGAQPRWQDAVVARFGIDERWLDAFHILRTRLGLTPYLLECSCAACGVRHVAVLGYGELQPARYLLTFDGLARVRDG